MNVDVKKLFYNEELDSYVIPSKYITKGIMKNIEQVLHNEQRSKEVRLYSLTRNVSFHTKEHYTVWGDDHEIRKPLQDMSEPFQKLLTWFNNDVYKNILRQGWVSSKQHTLCINILKQELSGRRTPSWESEDDSMLSPSYYGLINT